MHIGLFFLHIFSDMVDLPFKFLPHLLQVRSWFSFFQICSETIFIVGFKFSVVISFRFLYTASSFLFLTVSWLYHLITHLLTLHLLQWPICSTNQNNHLQLHASLCVVVRSWYRRDSIYQHVYYILLYIQILHRLEEAWFFSSDSLSTTPFQRDTFKSPSHLKNVFHMPQSFPGMNSQTASTPHLYLSGWTDFIGIKELLNQATPPSLDDDMCVVSPPVLFGLLHYNPWLVCSWSCPV